MKIYFVFLAGMLLVQGLGAYVIKEQKVFCAGHNYIITLYSNKNKSESSLFLSKILPGGPCKRAALYDQTGAYKIVVKSFALSNTGELSLVVPFEDGHDYQTTVNMHEFDKLCQYKSKNKNKKNMNDCFIALSHDKFYKQRQ